ncbi:alpha/beta hydrolase family protein [Variovorax rhizosphaerae]|uniref:Alpha/beta fold hydrolase n=1 Tax=Variovorax rhizosphaerae TaxID=1836200 RepID=A0ABU8WXN6_9BURK
MGKAEVAGAFAVVTRAPSPIIPSTALQPGVLFVHGWDSDKAHYQDLSDEIAALGCVCLTFDMRGHGDDAEAHRDVSREDNLQDVLAAYDALVRTGLVDPEAVALIGTSYGGYLAAIASSQRRVRWLALRVPALYPDAQWDVPKSQLDREAVARYRSRRVRPEGNRALMACQAFRGDALVVESGRDTVVPHPAIASFASALRNAHTLSHSCIDKAGHELSAREWQKAYETLLTAWISKQLLRQRGAATVGS